MDHFLALPPDGFKPLWTGLVAPATILSTLRTVHGSHAAETTKLGSFDFANNQRLTDLSQLSTADRVKRFRISRGH